jgi:serine/threonine protein phosphatase PrpC
VSSGGRANGRWKPDNQDAFLVQPTASPAAAGSVGASEVSAAAAEAPGAAAIGVFDGHGRLGGAAAAIARRAMSERLAALLPEGGAAATSRSMPAADDLLRGCFDAADAALAASGKDFSKSGCTAVLALLDRGGLSVGWAGDSRAVLGVCGGPAPPTGGATATLNVAAGPASLLAAAAGNGSLSSGSSSGSFDLAAAAACAAVPLTQDHKPDR